MSTANDPRVTAPSWAALAKTTAIAVLSAALLLVTIVLPAEYGIDPLGAGKALGLTTLAAPSMPVPPPSGDVLAPVQQGPVALYPGQYKIDAREFVLGPYEYIEYKYELAENATMLFSWTASGDVLHDLHGDRHGAAANAAESFDGNPRRQADGSFTAPFSGIHGWFWENPGGESITVRVTTAGFYTAAHEFHFDGTREAREVRDLDGIALYND